MYGGLFETKRCLKAPGNIMSSCQVIIDTLALAHSFRPTHLPKKQKKVELGGATFFKQIGVQI